jgi:hypothetical protein
VIIFIIATIIATFAVKFLPKEAIHA